MNRTKCANQKVFFFLYTTFIHKSTISVHSQFLYKTRTEKKLQIETFSTTFIPFSFFGITRFDDDYPVWKKVQTFHEQFSLILFQPTVASNFRLYNNKKKIVFCNFEADIDGSLDRTIRWAFDLSSFRKSISSCRKNHNHNSDEAIFTKTPCIHLKTRAKNNNNNNKKKNWSIWPPLSCTGQAETRVVVEQRSTCFFLIRSRGTAAADNVNNIAFPQVGTRRRGARANAII